MAISLEKLYPYRFRILATSVFILFLISTWLLFHKPPEYSETLHLSLQEQLKQLIRTTLLQKKPSAQNLQFQQVRIQVTSKKHILKAYFQYSFEDNKVQIYVKGSGRITRQAVPDSDSDLWIMDSIQIDHTSLDFQEPVLLRPTSSPATSPPTPSVKSPTIPLQSPPPTKD